MGIIKMVSSNQLSVISLILGFIINYLRLTLV
ncbi:hypothetical protein cce_1564 [Crocosphaera subtropica ATCC 51142]|uniref:Uncharacterized protein n=1 Tax=Crocosphaera subtropica (strain ATCC 51142 / BH68) TaxID=43989 RepID=B1WXS7_CROS5|nr:hypothetical protein cce_1564 [Crocosphaera subtropica ATCC 51142]